MRIAATFDDRYAAYVKSGNGLQVMDDFLDLRIHPWLHGCNDDVLAASGAPPAFIEHAERLSHARRIAEKNLKLPPPFGALGRLHLLQESFWIWSGVAFSRHQSSRHSRASRMASSDRRSTTRRFPGGSSALWNKWFMRRAQPAGARTLCSAATVGL